MLDIRLAEKLVLAPTIIICVLMHAHAYARGRDREKRCFVKVRSHYFQILTAILLTAVFS